MYKHLCEKYPKNEGIQEISEATGYDERDVRGALLGDGDRFKAKDSLVALWLAEQNKDDTQRPPILKFRTKPQGLDIEDVLKGYMHGKSLVIKLKGFALNLKKRKDKKLP